MSLIALAAEYRASAALLTDRITELRRKLKHTRRQTAAWLELNARIDQLEEMRDDTNATARELERYYDPGGEDDRRAGLG